MKFYKFKFNSFLFLVFLSILLLLLGVFVYLYINANVTEYLAQDLTDGLNDLNNKLDILDSEYDIVNNYMDTNLKYEDQTDPTTGEIKTVRIPPPAGYNVNLNDVMNRLSMFPPFLGSSVSVEDIGSSVLPYV